MKQYYVSKRSDNKKTILYEVYSTFDVLVSKFKSERAFKTALMNDGYYTKKLQDGIWRDNGENVMFWRADVAPSHILNKMCKSDWNKFHKALMG